MIGVTVAGDERGYVISASRELASFVGVGEEVRPAFMITESPAKLCIVVGNEVFRILVWVGGRGGGSTSLCFPLPSRGGACRGLGLRLGAGPWGCRGEGAVMRYDRSLIAHWRTERSWGGGGV